MNAFTITILVALISTTSACLGGSGSGCCPQSQPSCGNPCASALPAASVGAYPVAPPSYAVPPSPAYPVAGGAGAYPTVGK